MSDTLMRIVIGTKVSTNLYNRGVGYVCDIKGKESPETVRSICRGIGRTGGSAKYDIVFESGSFSRDLPETILHGLQWKIYSAEDGFATAEKLAALCAKAEAIQAEKELIAEEARAVFDAEAARLREDPAYAKLEQADEGSGVTAAKNIRLLLKEAFPGVKFSVRKSDYSSVVIHTTETIDKDKLREIAFRFRPMRSHNGNADQYTPWMRVFGHADYISV